MIDMLFSFVAYFNDRATVLLEKVAMRMLCTMFFDLISSATGLKTSESTDHVQIPDLRRYTNELMQIVEVILDLNLETWLLKQRYHLLGHFMDDLEGIGSLKGLDESRT